MSETAAKETMKAAAEAKEIKETQAPKGKSRMSVKDLTTLGLLTGILLVMNFTPLGYIHTFGVDISLMMIPVGIGAMLMGPKGGTWLGFIFGATSFYQALTGTSVFSATLFNISPLRTFLLCIPTRMLMGFLTGVLFLIFSKLDRKKTVCFFAGGFFAAFLNTLFFMGTLILLFWNTEYIQTFNSAFGGVNPFLFVVLFVGVNGALEWPASAIIGGVVSKAINRTLYKKVI